jgi:hypothetical protein
VFPFDIASLLFPYFPPADCYLDYAEDGPGLIFLCALGGFCPAAAGVLAFIFASPAIWELADARKSAGPLNRASTDRMTLSAFLGNPLVFDPGEHIRKYWPTFQD